MNMIESKENTSIPIPDKYSINLMWLNQKPQDVNNTYICSDKKLKKIIESSSIWKKENPEATVNVWYDSQTTHLKAIKATIEKIKTNNIELKDIRTIKVVAANPDVFSYQMPLFYRVDLLKLIICTHEAQLNDCAIFSDLDIKVYGTKEIETEEGIKKVIDFCMNKKTLFSDQIRNNLTKIGFVHNGGLGSENQFLQLVNEKKIMSTMKHIININLMRGAFGLNLPNEGLVDKADYMSTIYNAVFCSTTDEIPLHYEACNFGRIEVIGDNEKHESYDVKNHGHMPFGNSYFSKYFRNYFIVRKGEEPKLRSKEIRFLSNDSSEGMKKIVMGSGPFCKASNAWSFGDGGSHTDTFFQEVPPSDNSDEYKWTTWEEAEKQ